jgi:uncharacterized membrane protein YkvA (DUF1232 family)
MEVLGWLILLAVLAPIVNKVVPAIVEGIEEGKERRERAALKKDLAQLPPVERVMVRQQYLDAASARAKPVFASGAVTKGGGLGKFVVVALCIGYILFPIDLIPDVIPVLGWGDDVVAGLIALTTLLRK